MNSPRIVLAYHGCDANVGEKILAGEAEIQASNNDYDWLGGGAYFWEDSPARALQWANFLREFPAGSKGKINTPFVIGAIISTGNCLDLADAKSVGVVRDAYDEFAKISRRINIALPENQPGFHGDADLVKRHLDCAIFNFVHILQDSLQEPAFDTIRCPFFEGEPLFPSARIASKTHLQWCVRDPAKSILGYFRLRKSTLLMRV